MQKKHIEGDRMAEFVLYRVTSFQFITWLTQRELAASANSIDATQLLLWLLRRLTVCVQ